MRDLGWTEVSVAVVDLAPGEERALNAVLNNREMQSNWDADNLCDLLSTLGGCVPLSATGFVANHLNLLRDPKPQPPLQAQPVAPATHMEGLLRIPLGIVSAVQPCLDALAGQAEVEMHPRHR